MKKLTFLTAVAFSPLVNFRRVKAKAGLLLLLLSPLFITACANDNKQVEALDKETMDIHDEAMKDMADMNRVARELKATMIAAIMTPEQSAIYTEVLANIGNAENGMTDWMKNYKSPEGMPAAEALKYLTEQKALIEKNHSDIKAALEAGKKLQGK